MTNPFDEHDPLLRALQALPPRDVAATRSEDIRHRCRATIARRVRRRHERDLPTRRSWGPLFEPAMVAGLALVFLVEIARRAADLF